METFVEVKNLVHNPHFRDQKQNALINLRRASIDDPISDLITRFANLSYCFTLQSCYGHFLLEEQSDPRNIAPLPILDHKIDVEYRIAYLAVCVSDNHPGKLLLKELSKLCLIDPRNIQFGCAEWFWERQINSYIVQVEPERHKTKDRCVVSYQEARYLEKVRDRFFDELEMFLEKRENEIGSPSQGFGNII